MVFDSYIMLMGVVSSEVRYAKTKEGKDYAAFTLCVGNGTNSLTNKYSYFSVFVEDGYYYNLIRNNRLGREDEVLVRGKFIFKQANDKRSFNLIVYAKETLVLRSNYYDRQFSQQNSQEYHPTTKEDSETQKPTNETQPNSYEFFDWGK